MSISPGRTTEEIREFVHEYQLQPHGTKRAWLAGRGVSYDRLQRWRAAVFEGDLDRALISREGVPVSIPPGKRTVFERRRAEERESHDSEVARLNARVRELEQTNEALGKAIGLLHAMSDQEPDDIQETNEPSSS